MFLAVASWWPLCQRPFEQQRCVLQLQNIVVDGSSSLLSHTRFIFSYGNFHCYFALWKFSPTWEGWFGAAQFRR